MVRKWTRQQPTVTDHHRGARVWWRRILTLAMVALIIGVCVNQAHHIEWDKVIAAVRANTGSVVIRASGLAMLGYFIYSCFDLLAIPTLRHQIPPLRIMAIGVVVYAFNLNVGALIGSVGFRFRLYSKLLPPAAIAHIVGLGIFTNWIGYLWIAGILCLWGKLPLSLLFSSPSQIGTTASQLIGVVMLVVACSYVGLCAGVSRRSWSVWGHDIVLPSMRVALAQSVLGAAHWVCISGVLWVLMRQEVPYVVIMGAQLVSSVAGAVAHIPGGLGIMEIVFVAMLGDRVPNYKILGALFTYRAIYYLVPFVFATLLYFILEARLRVKHAR
jgi:uncharacterized membrane protein YbhN (UPF0104 family)